MKRFLRAGGAKRPQVGHGSSTVRPARLMAVAALLLLAVAIFAAAGQASEAEAETLGAQLQKAARQSLKAAEQASREALKTGNKEAIQQKRAAHRALREAGEAVRKARNLGPKAKGASVVTIGCTKVTVELQGFNSVAGSPNYVVEWVALKQATARVPHGPLEYKPVLISFTGTEDLDVRQIAFPVGHYTIVVHAKWDTNGVKGGFQAISHVTCPPAPAYTISTLQSIAGSGQAPTGEPLAARVGEVVDYASTVTNTGNTPVTFSDFEDAQCDAGTIVGGSLTPVEPSDSLTFECIHKLTAADQAAGSYADTATITGEPEAYEGGPVAHSNTVLISPIGAAEATGTGGDSNTTTTVTVVTSKTTTGSTSGRSGVLTFKAASVPGLKGPRGCVRSGFTVSVRSAGVSTVVFAMDGRKLARRTYQNAHGGLISIRINPARLKAGPHRLSAAITMKTTPGTAKAASATRRLIVVRCK